MYAIIHLLEFVGHAFFTLGIFIVLMVLYMWFLGGRLPGGG